MTRGLLTLRCCDGPPRADWRSVSLTELRLPSFFFRLRNLLSAERSVDFLRWGGLLETSWADVSPVLPELMLRVENRVVVDGFVRWYRAGELLAADAPDEAPPSGLGPADPRGCAYGCGDGEPGCSGTVCGTSTVSARTGVAADCATGAKACVTGEARVEIGCCGGCGGTGSLSSGVALAMPVPGFLIGNSSSSMVGVFVIGMGPDILRPRMLWWPVLGLAVVGEAGPKTLVFFMVASLSMGRLNLWAAGKVFGGGEALAVLILLEVGTGGGPEEP